MERLTLTRRDFIKAGVGAALLPLSTEAHESFATEPIEYLKPRRSLAKVEKLSLTVAEALAAIIPYAPLITTEEDVLAFRNEFVPYLALTGFQDTDKLIIPTITFKDFGETYNTMSGFYLMGLSRCGGQVNEEDMYKPSGPPPDGSIEINKRFLDTYSPLQRIDRNNELTGVLAHELCHSNNVSCEPSYPFFGDPDMVEGTTQIAAMNTLFAMSMDGSRLALPAALSDMELMSRHWVWVHLYEQKRLDLYEEFLSKYPDHSLMEGEWNFIKAQGDVSGFIRAADSYGKRPFDVVSNTMVREDFETRDLPVPHDTLKLPHINFVLSNLSHFVDDYIKDGKQ